eukprot:TRINITY_DN9771_c0_g1_i1.p2 TRINITY_DN9771_c0_g1~~TRINITY_DN9771_c0_g1_i1.p2  ORF type:complete len:157 (+),score=28.54 TRINITY_DN9771_c0_g1_i1:49-471(+)
MYAAAWASVLPPVVRSELDGVVSTLGGLASRVEAQGGGGGGRMRSRVRWCGVGRGVRCGGWGPRRPRRPLLWAVKLRRAVQAGAERQRAVSLALPAVWLTDRCRWARVWVGCGLPSAFFWCVLPWFVRGGGGVQSATGGR